MLRRVLCVGNKRGFLSSRAFSAQQGRSIVLQDTKQVVKSPWTERKDPAGSALTYYWNTDTDETTALGASRPLHWVEVRDPAGSALTYWWSPETSLTTPLGADKPPSSLAEYQRDLQLYQQQQVQYQYGAPSQSLGSSMKTYLALGFGMSFAFALVARLLS